MPLSTLVDCTQIYVSSTGTGPLTLGAAVTGFQGREALTDGALYSYRILTGGAAYEFGQGTWVSSTNTLTRTPMGSSDGGAAISVPVNAQVAITVLAEDLRNIVYGQAAAAAAGAEAAQALIDTLVSGGIAFSLPDEANGDIIPSPGSGLPYLSAGVLKIA